MYKLIGLITIFQHEISEAKDKFEIAALNGYSTDEINQEIDNFHDMICDYLEKLMETYL